MINDLISEENLQAVAAKAADLLLHFPWKVWFWGDSVGFEGLLDASELTGLGKYSGFVYGVFKGWVARERFRSEFDYNLPGVALLRVYKETGDAHLLSAARRHADYLSGFRRTTSGAYMRYENSAIELPPELPINHPDAPAARRLADQVTDGGPCIFVDSMHVDAPFFAKLYETTGEDCYRRLSLRMMSSQVELLYDAEKQLLNHFWIEKTKSPNGVAWGRGNCWGLLGLVETLEHLPEGDPDTENLREALRTIVARMAQLQSPDGGWHTILDDPDSYIETSIPAFMVPVLARSITHSWIEPDLYYPVIESAMSFVLDHIREDGLLEGVSYETFPSTRVEHYRQMPRGAVVPWGQGPLLAALKAYALLKRSPQFSGKQIGG